MKQKIIIAGGTGFLGHSIISTLPDWEVIVLSRKKHNDKGSVRYVQWDAKNEGPWQQELEGSEALINLVGKSVNCRYTEKNKREIIASRVDSTLLLSRAINACYQPPKVWINAGSTAIFGDGGSDVKSETSVVGDGFPAEVCQRWEQHFQQVTVPGTRKVLLRISLVFQKKRGLLHPFVTLVRVGLGGKIGTGQQYMSWIHEDDFTALIHELIDNNELSGTFHAASPYPVTNDEFLTTLRAELHMPFGLPTPALLAKAGAFLIGTESQLILLGRRVVSKRLADRQFVFKYPHLSGALAHLLS